jgi:HAD superfamily hydrolase (TIGR01490 family)
MQAIALYDLDRTVTCAPTFTPFLLHMAARPPGLRLLAVPLWVLAMAGYKAGLYGRKRLKQFGLALLVGRVVRNPTLQPAIDAFVARQLSRNIRPGARAQIAADQAAGVRCVLLTAAPEIYAEALAAALGFADCIATKHRRDATGHMLALIEGENNYGPEKVRRVEAWLAEQGLARSEVHLTAYSDHPSDAPILDFADRGVLVGHHAPPQARWGWVDWGRPA